MTIIVNIVSVEEELKTLCSENERTLDLQIRVTRDLENTERNLIEIIESIIRLSSRTNEVSQMHLEDFNKMTAEKEENVLRLEQKKNLHVSAQKTLDRYCKEVMDFQIDTVSNSKTYANSTDRQKRSIRCNN